MLILLSLDHRRSTVLEREPFAISPADRFRLGRLIRRACGGQAAFLVTCNRVEILAWVPAPTAQVARARVEVIAHRVSPALAREFLSRATIQTGELAARHLLRVAAGLESQVLGDVQVLSQVRAAYALAAESGSVGAELHRLFQTSLRSGKRVHAETGFGTQRPSVGRAVARLVAEKVGSTAAQIVVLGAGATAAGAARSLAARGMRVTIVNRSSENAALLAGKIGADLAPFDARHAIIARADVAVVATGAPEPTVTVESLEAARREAGRAHRLIILDLAVPRNVETHVARLDGVELLGLEDAIGEADSTENSANSLAAAEQVLTEELGTFLSWLDARETRGVAAA